MPHRARLGTVDSRGGCAVVCLTRIHMTNVITRISSLVLQCFTFFRAGNLPVCHGNPSAECASLGDQLPSDFSFSNLSLLCFFIVICLSHNISITFCAATFFHFQHHFTRSEIWNRKPTQVRTGHVRECCVRRS